MIFVDRTAIDLPFQLNQELKQAAAVAAKFYARKDRVQERFVFNEKVLQQTRSYLERLFDNTCAFCESPKGEKAPLLIEPFRPRTEACNLDGLPDPDWYWWLAYEWKNLYLICQSCSLHKKNLFPVNGKRTRIGTVGEMLEKEKYLLLDPCADNPAEHLNFTEDGWVRSSSLDKIFNFSGDQRIDRGALTIQILALNRVELVTERVRIIEEVKKILTPSRINSLDSSLINDLLSLVNEFSTFVGLKRQLVARFLHSDKDLRKRLRRFDPVLTDEIEETIQAELKAASTAPSKTGIVRLKQIKSKALAPSSAIEIKHDTVYIRRVEIRNFRSLRKFEINFNELAPLSAAVYEGTQNDNDPVFEIGSESEPGLVKRRKTGWKMILGENGVGKSSVLKAIALALMGEDFYKKNKTDYRWLPKRIFNNKTREKSGYIKIELSKGEPIEVHFTNTSLNFRSGKKGADGVYLRGYGSARLFSHQQQLIENNLPESGSTPKSIANLFHPEILLANPASWLSVIPVNVFNSAALSLRDLLNLPDDIKKPLNKKGKIINLDSGNGSSPLSEQSDGYKSVLALMVDILRDLPSTMHDKSEATGIVLLDEIESHLHPRWKMRIVNSLRQAFPNIQFICTTHDPLCLRGLEKGEITVMQRASSGQLNIFDDVQSPAGLRVDQLLTSELFGLDSTIDPEIDDKFYNYYQLLAESRALGDEQPAARKDLLNKLGLELQQFNKLGFTRRDQMVYQLIDEFIADSQRTSGLSEIGQLREETKRRVFKIWEMTGLREVF